MEWSNDLIGRCSAPKTHHIHRGALEQFARALELHYLPYFDPEAAKSAGFRDVIAPPTFAITLTANEIPGLELPGAGIIHGEQQFSYHEPITAGDEIQVVQCIEKLKARGAAVFLTLKTAGRNTQGDEVFVSRSLLIVNLDSVSHKESAQ